MYTHTHLVILDIEWIYVAEIYVSFLLFTLKNIFATNPERVNFNDKRSAISCVFIRFLYGIHGAQNFNYKYNFSWTGKHNINMFYYALKYTHKKAHIYFTYYSIIQPTRKTHFSYPKYEYILIEKLDIFNIVI